MVVEHRQPSGCGTVADTPTTTDLKLTFKQEETFIGSLHTTFDDAAVRCFEKWMDGHKHHQLFKVRLQLSYSY